MELFSFVSSVSSSISLLAGRESHSLSRKTLTSTATQPPYSDKATCLYRRLSFPSPDQSSSARPRRPEQMPAGNAQTSKPAPIRTNTGSSNASNIWTLPALSTPSSTATSPSPSQAEQNFFGALAQKVRDRSRSRSRSRSATQHSHTSTSPTSARSQPTPSSPMSHRPSYTDRHASESSTASSSSSHGAKRTSTSGSEQSEFERFSYGRHSNDVSRPLLVPLLGHLTDKVAVVVQWLQCKGHGQPHHPPPSPQQ